MSLSEDLTWRGLVKDKTFEKPEFLDSPKTFYHGVDASSDSLTIGNLAALMMARRLLEAGWKAVLLVGGATSLIGDPGGKDSERSLQPREEILANVSAIKGQINQLFGGQDFTLVDNYDWFSEVKYLDFLRDVGKNFSMTELMQRDFVAARMGTEGKGISYAEFSYSLIQGYDFWQLFKKHGAVLQIGGSDQWGNMLSGVALVRKKENQEVHALSMPLVIDKSTGNKFGKSEAGAVWLDATKTTPTQFYQFWINSDDADVETYLKIFTLMSREEIEQVMASQVENPAARFAQTELAKNVTALVHGQTDSAQGVTKYLASVYAGGDYSGGPAPQEDIGGASEDELELIRKEIPSIKVPTAGSIIDALATSGLAGSNTEARRLLGSGAVYINGQSVSRENFEPSDFKNGPLILRRGKAHKDSALVELE